jgi:hypothetical protein
MDPGIAGALIGGAFAVVVAIYGGSRFVRRRHATLDQENRAREAARALIPQVDFLRMRANEALRTNRAAHLSARLGTLEDWTPETRRALAGGLDEDKWGVVSLGIESMQLSLERDFFSNLPNDGTVGRDAAVGALNCSHFASQVLFVLAEAASDPTWDPKKKLDAALEQFEDYRRRSEEIPRLHPEFERWLHEEGERQAQRRALELEQIAEATVPPPNAPE